MTIHITFRGWHQNMVVKGRGSFREFLHKIGMPHYSTDALFDCRVLSNSVVWKLCPVYLSVGTTTIWRTNLTSLTRHFLLFIFLLENEQLPGTTIHYNLVDEGINRIKVASAFPIFIYIYIYIYICAVYIYMLIICLIL